MDALFDAREARRYAVRHRVQSPFQSAMQLTYELGKNIIKADSIQWAVVSASLIRVRPFLIHKYQLSTLPITATN